MRIVIAMEVEVKIPEDRANVNEIFMAVHELAKQRESEIVEGHLCPDHVHMLIRIPPKFSVSGW